MALKKPVVTNHRNAVNGRFVTETYAKTHKSTTTTERNPRPTPTNKAKKTK